MTTPVITRIKVRNYERWRPIFDSHANTRKAAGCQGTQVFKNARDENEIVISFQWDTQANAQKYLDSPAMGQNIEAAGVISGDIWYLQEVKE
jgi:quinol monooxygenase YgiN